LYDKKSFIGKWLSSKNTIEKINGNLFAHGGIHPDVANSNVSLDEINQSVRSNYYRAYYPKVKKMNEELLISNKKEFVGIVVILKMI